MTALCKLSPAHKGGDVLLGEDAASMEGDSGGGDGETVGVALF